MPLELRSLHNREATHINHSADSLAGQSGSELAGQSGSPADRDSRTEW